MQSETSRDSQFQVYKGNGCEGLRNIPLQNALNSLEMSNVHSRGTFSFESLQLLHQMLLQFQSLATGAPKSAQIS